MVKMRTISGIDEIERVSHLSALVFKKDDYERSYEWFKDLHLRCPYIRNDLCWVAEVDGEIVSKAQIIEYTMHVGRSIVKMGGVASVLTDPPYRRKGYASMLTKRCVEFMAESGFDMSVLFSLVGDFYERFGYITAMPDFELTMRVSDVKGEGVDGFRKMKEEDIEPVLEFYHRSNDDRTGAILRPKNAWKWMHRKPPIFLVREDGYIGVNFSDEAVELFDVASADERFYNEAILKLASMARERNLKLIKAFVAPDHPFALLAAKHGSRMTIFYSRTGNCMARIINIHSLFEKICPELEDRIKRSEFNKSAVHLSIKSDVGEIEMTLNETCFEKIDLSLDLPQTAITQLVMGYKPAQIILSENEISLDQISMRALDVLFPRGYPFIWRADQF